MEGFLKSGKLGGGPLKPKPKKVDPEKKAALVPWVEKYRPRTVEDVAYQDEVVAVLKNSIQGNDLPNMLFYGPPGTGKTSTILAASRQLFGDMYRSRVLELNASDERGIAVIREKVKTFAQVAVSNTREDGKPCPGFKIIILDEADSMTKDAQSALRRTMEKQSQSTRFCLICNYVSRIIGPLTSRCSKFRFKPLNRECIIARLKLVAAAEGLSCDDSALDALVETSDGDMRRAITLLQCAVKLKVADTVQSQDIYEASGVIPDKWISDLFSACASGYKDIDAFTDALLVEGYSSTQLLIQIHRYVIANDDLTDNNKSVIAQKLAECDARLLDGAEEYLQIMDLACTIMAQLKK